MSVQDTYQFAPFLFDGRMVVSKNPFALNPSDYPMVHNMRYVPDGLQDRGGCIVDATSDINDGSTTIRSLIQLQVDRYSLNRIIAQADDLKYYYKDTPETAAGYTELTSSFGTEDASALKAIACRVGEHFVIVNGKENHIYSGTQPRLAAILKYDNATGVYSSYLDEIYSSKTTDVMSVGSLSTSDYLYFGFFRPFSALTFNFNANVNTNACTWDVEYFNGAWTDASGDSDGTDDAGTSFGQDGTYSWTLPSDWQPFVVNGGLWYFIRMKPSAQLSATVEIVDVYPTSPIQPLVNLWDQTWQPISGAYHYDASAVQYKDYLPQVTDKINGTHMKLDSFQGGANDYIYVGTPYRPLALMFKVNPDYVNSGAAVISEVAGWDGEAWDAGTNVSDGTKGATGDQASINKNGILSWDKESVTWRRRALASETTPMYWTRIKFDADAVSTDVRIWDISYIPDMDDPSGAQSCLEFKTRLMLVGPEDFPNEVWISAPYNPQGFNGGEFTRLVFSDGRQLVDGTNFYNEAMVFKEDETWLIQGYRKSGTGAFGRLLLDPKIGAFRKTVQLARMWVKDREGTPDDYRIVAIFQHRSGVYFCDGTKPRPISDDISSYFNPDSSLYVGDVNIAGSDSMYDWVRDEYHLFLGNYEFVYSTRAQAWSIFDRSVDLTSFICAVGTQGQGVLLGGTAIGRVHQLENGAVDKDSNGNDAAITYYVDTKCHWPGQLQHQYDVRQFSLITDAKSDGATLTLIAAKDGYDLDGGEALSLDDTFSTEDTTREYVKKTYPLPPSVSEGVDTIQMRIKNTVASKRAKLIACAIGLRAIRDHIDED